MVMMMPTAGFTLTVKDKSRTDQGREKEKTTTVVVVVVVVVVVTHNAILKNLLSR